MLRKILSVLVVLYPFCFGGKTSISSPGQVLFTQIRRHNSLSLSLSIYIYTHYNIDIEFLSRRSFQISGLWKQRWISVVFFTRTFTAALSQLQTVDIYIYIYSEPLVDQVIHLVVGYKAKQS